MLQFEAIPPQQQESDKTLEPMRIRAALRQFDALSFLEFHAVEIVPYRNASCASSG